MRFAIFSLLLIGASAVVANGISTPTMKAWPQVGNACVRLEEIAKRESVQWRIVCPNVVPRVRQPVLAYAGGYAAVNNLRSGYALGFASLAAGNGYGHWTFDSGSLRTLFMVSLTSMP